LRASELKPTGGCLGSRSTSQSIWRHWDT